MSRFRISSHGRLQDWIAVERGFFDEEGLDYEFDVRVLENAAQDISAEAQQDIRVRAYELYLSGISRWDRRSLFRSGERVVFLAFTGEVYRRSPRLNPGRGLV